MIYSVRVSRQVTTEEFAIVDMEADTEDEARLNAPMIAEKDEDLMWIEKGDRNHSTPQVETVEVIGDPDDIIVEDDA